MTPIYLNPKELAESLQALELVGALDSSRIERRINW